MLNACGCAVCATTLCPSFVPWHQHAIGCPVRVAALARDERQGIKAGSTEKTTSPPDPLVELGEQGMRAAHWEATRVCLDAIGIQSPLRA
jgi:hypothetical protein